MLHSLQSLLDTTSGIPIENHQVFFILMEVALALHEIHSLGIAHLDIKQPMSSLVEIPLRN